VHRLEKYQDLPTRGARAVEQFSINWNLFSAFANFYNETEGYKTYSFIYKLNDLNEKFYFYQKIRTIGARDIEYFTIADKHYLAVANRYNGASHQMNSVIYQWNGHQFVALQSIPTNGATSFNFFKILQELFLTVTNYRDDTTYSVNSVIYKWKENHGQFEKYQEIGTEGAVGSKTFAINNETFIAFGNNYNFH